MNLSSLQNSGKTKNDIITQAADFGITFTVKTLNIGTPRPTTVVVHNIK